MTPEMIPQLVRSVRRIREPVLNRGWGEGGGQTETERERERNEYRGGAKKRHGSDDFVGLPLPSTKMFKGNKI